VTAGSRCRWPTGPSQVQAHGSEFPHGSIQVPTADDSEGPQTTGQLTPQRAFWGPTFRRPSSSAPTSSGRSSIAPISRERSSMAPTSRGRGSTTRRSGRTDGMRRPRHSTGERPASSSSDPERAAELEPSTIRDHTYGPEPLGARVISPGLQMRVYRPLATRQGERACAGDVLPTPCHQPASSGVLPSCPL
jgi:hypothetical protein